VRTFSCIVMLHRLVCLQCKVSRPLEYSRAAAIATAWLSAAAMTVLQLLQITVHHLASSVSVLNGLTSLTVLHTITSATIVTAATGAATASSSSLCTLPSASAVQHTATAVSEVCWGHCAAYGEATCHLPRPVPRCRCVACCLDHALWQLW
jgi:hypothetical protein